MDIDRHDHKPDTIRLVLIENFVEPPQQNAFGMVLIQKFAPAEDLKRDEVDVQLVIDDSSVCSHPQNAER